MEPECFVSSNCDLICRIYEAALSQGLESDWHFVEGSHNLYMVEVQGVTRKDFEKLVFDVSNLPYIAIVRDGTMQQMTLHLAA